MPCFRLYGERLEHGIFVFRENICFCACLQDRYRDVIMTPEKKGGNNMSIYDTLNPKQKRQSYIQTALFLYWQAPVPERQGS